MAQRLVSLDLSAWFVLRPQRLHYPRIMWRLALILTRAEIPWLFTLSITTQTPTCYNTHPLHFHQINNHFTLRIHLLVAQRCAPLKQVAGNEAGAAESSTTYCGVFYHFRVAEPPLTA